MRQSQIKRLTFIRHGDTGMGGRYIGTTDVGLSPVGGEQAARLGRMLQSETFETVWCSPLRRCRETLTALRLTQQATFSEAIEEISFGAWEGLDFNQIARDYPLEVKQWAETPEAFTFPQGEAIAAFRCRVRGFLQQLCDQESTSIVVITHGGVIRAALCELLELPWPCHLYLQVKNARCTCLRLFDNCRGLLTGFNLEVPQWHD